MKVLLPTVAFLTGTALGAGYGFLALASMGLVVIVLAVVMLPFLVLTALPRVPLGRELVFAPLGVGFVLGFGFGYSWLIVSAWLRCQLPKCTFATSPVEAVAWGLGFLAVPFVLIAIALSIRAAGSSADRAASEDQARKLNP